MELDLVRHAKPTETTLKILFLSADPSDKTRLRLGQELKNIQEKLNLSKYQEKFILSHCLSAKPTDISQAILNSNPNIVHFSGHGLYTGELCFENHLGKMQPVKPEVLADLFELVSDQTNCVLLNACYSKIQAEAIVKHISYVIGMNQSIGDQAAIAFSIGFYKAIGAGYSIDKAFKFGCVEIRLEESSQYRIPELLTRKSVTPLKDVPKVKWVLKVKGTLTNDNKHEVEAIAAKLCEILGDSSLKLKKMYTGSIRLVLEGSQEEFEIFKELVESGRITEVLGFQIESVQSSELKVSAFQKSQDLNRAKYKPKAIQNLRSLHALVEVDNHGNAVKVSWGKHSEVTDTGLEYLSTLTTLVELELAQITDARLAYLSNLVNLESLNLGNSAKITDSGLPNLVNLKKLKTLNLSYDSFVTVKGLEQLKGLSELRYLGVPETLSLEYVTKFPLLEIVYAVNKNDSEIKYLETLNNIQELYIWSPEVAEVTDASVKTLIKLKSLKILYLWDTQISEQGLKQIQNELPNCDIDFALIKDESTTEFDDQTIMSIFKRKIKDKRPLGMVH